jgi:acetyl-CoA carboxylase biotin carboxyl carrier protein
VTLTAADVAEIMRVIEESTFDELSLEMDGVKLTLRRAGAAGGFVQSMSTQSELSRAAAKVASRSDAAIASAAANTAAPSGASDAPDANLRDIISPMLGTFYRCPKPGSAPFVEMGSVVDVDSVIAIIEVMKLMNTVRAGVRGVVTEILAADETLVEFGEILMRVQTDT